VADNFCAAGFGVRVPSIERRRALEFRGAFDYEGALRDCSCEECGDVVAKGCVQSYVFGMI